MRKINSKNTIFGRYMYSLILAIYDEPYLAKKIIIVMLLVVLVAVKDNYSSSKYRRSSCKSSRRSG